MLRNSQSEAKRIGISVQDFIRMLMATYFANAGSIRSISRNQALFDRAQDEIKHGKFAKVTSPKELADHLAALNS